MSASYYDVVVLGSDIAPLACGSLLAKRGFRVLVLGQGEHEPVYGVGPFTLPRRPFHFVLGNSPVRQRVFPELGLSQSLRRASKSLDPAFQVAIPGHRFDVSNQDANVAREVEREFPEVKRPIDDFHKYVERASRALDSVIERDLVWPPETFLERQRFVRARRKENLPHEKHASELLAEFPEQHPFRLVSQLPALFECAVDPEQLSPLMLARAYDNCRRGSVALDGGLPALHALMIQKIHAHSGQVKLHERASEIVVQRGHATGVRIFGTGEDVSCGFVVVGTDVSSMLRTLPDRAPFEELFERIGEPLLRRYRYTLNVVMRREGIPVGLREQLYFVRDQKQSGAASHLRIQTQTLDADHVLLCTEALLASRQVEDEEGFVSGVRAKVLGSLRELLPFLDRHIVLVDSPHDDLGPEGQAAADTKLDVSTLSRRGPATMPPVYSYPVLSTLGMCALPVRTPIKQLLFCNAQLAPGLGSEGQWLAACSTARVVTRADRSRAWMRRRLWAKVEM